MLKFSFTFLNVGNSKGEQLVSSSKFEAKEIFLKRKNSVIAFSLFDNQVNESSPRVYEFSRPPRRSMGYQEGLWSTKKPLWNTKQICSQIFGSEVGQNQYMIFFVPISVLGYDI